MKFKIAVMQIIESKIIPIHYCLTLIFQKVFLCLGNAEISDNSGVKDNRESEYWEQKGTVKMLSSLMYMHHNLMNDS